MNRNLNVTNLLSTGTKSGVAALACLLALAYLIGLMAGQAIGLAANAVFGFWLANSIVLSALLLTERRVWWAWFLAMTPAHVMFATQSGIELAVLLYAVNSLQSLLIALTLNYVLQKRLHFDRVVEVNYFLFIAVIVAPAICFSALALIKLPGLERTGLQIWRTGLLSYGLGNLILTPVCVLLLSNPLAHVQAQTPGRLIEVLALALATIVTSAISFSIDVVEIGNIAALSLTYAPVLILLWSAIRFGAPGVTCTVLTVSVIAIGYAGNGIGTFAADTLVNDGFALHLFLLFYSIPAFLIGALFSERTKAELALRQSELLLKDLVDHTVDLVWRANPQGSFTFLSPSLKAMSGFEPEELLHIPIQELARKFFTEDSSTIARESLERRLEGKFGDEAITYELNFKRKDGSTFTGETRSSPLLNSEGEIIATQGVTRDITEQKKLHEELHNSREMFQAFFINSKDPCGISDPVSGIILDVNPAFETTFGWSKIEAIGKTPVELDFFSPEGVVEMRKQVEQTNIEIPMEQYRVMVNKKSGGQRTCLVDSSKVEIAGMSRILFLIRDVTETEKMEKELLKIAKLESIGVFAGGIAHDLNNMLTSIVGNLSLAKIAESSEEKNRFIDESQRASFRLKGLAQQLLTFSKGGEPVLKIEEMGSLLFDAVQFSLRGSHVGAEFNIAEDLWQASVDSGQINQVISNLVINAQQAMRQAGKIQVSAQNVRVDFATPLPLQPGSYICISVTDPGVGISVEILQSIFDPFFTTKAAGSGLGLASAFSILQKHHGHIMASSEPGQGSEFKFYLPAELNRIELEQAQEWTPLNSNGGRILVMDDSEDILSVIEAMLDRLGFDVVTCINGIEAIQKYKETLSNGDAFSAVILDLTIPGSMGGKETVQKLIELDPQVKAIVASGYSGDSTIAHYEKYGFVSSLPKPYAMKELSETLDRVINAP